MARKLGYIGFGNDIGKIRKFNLINKIAPEISVAMV